MTNPRSTWGGNGPILLIFTRESGSSFQARFFLRFLDETRRIHISAPAPTTMRIQIHSLPCLPKMSKITAVIVHQTMGAEEAADCAATFLYREVATDATPPNRLFQAHLRVELRAKASVSSSVTSFTERSSVCRSEHSFALS